MVTGQAAGRPPLPPGLLPLERQDSGAAVGAALQTSELPATGCVCHVSWTP